MLIYFESGFTISNYGALRLFLFFFSSLFCLFSLFVDLSLPRYNWLELMIYVFLTLNYYLASANQWYSIEMKQICIR